jgi:rod shape determining protein RodA
MKKNYKKYDWLLIIIYLILVIWGILNLYSSDYNAIKEGSKFLSTFYGKQLIWVLISLLIAGIILMIDSVAFSMFAYVIYLIVIGLLFAIFVFGVVTHGARSWFVLGPIKIQPSEFAKFATALALARFISVNGFNFNWKNWFNIFVTLIIIGFPVFLILLQPDVGSALVYTSFILVLYREGLPGKWLLLILTATIIFVLAIILPQMILLSGIILVTFVLLFFSLKNKKHFTRIILSFLTIFALLYFLKTLFSIKASFIYITLFTTVIWASYLLIYYTSRKEAGVPTVLLFMTVAIIMQFSTNITFTKILQQHQRNRIEVLFDNSIEPRGIGYNLRQSKIAIGSGGFTGKGYLKGTQTKLDFVPAHNSDFIFCTLAEEWGFVGTFILFALYAILIIRIIIKSEQQLSDFSRIYGYSVASIFLIHFTVNIGMTIGLLPVIGIPLPFFSYGGSAMIGFTILLFIFIKLDSQKELKI